MSDGPLLTNSQIRKYARLTRALIQGDDIDPDDWRFLEVVWKELDRS